MSHTGTSTRTAPPPWDADELDRAFSALAKYDSGAGRAELLPIDRAAVAVYGDPARRKELERRLLVLVAATNSAPAKAYVCSMLAMMGTGASVPALVSLLGDARVDTCARTALEAISGREGPKALRRSLPRLSGVQKAGAIYSLGALRDQASVGVLAALLKDGSGEVRVASVNALGQIGSSRAARALLAFQSAALDSLRLPLADASLTCAESLAGSGKKSEARALLQSLQGPAQPAHVRAAAERRLRAL